MAAHQYPHAATSLHHEGPGRHAFNPVRGYMDIASNPIAYSKAEVEAVDSRQDLLAPFKVHKYSRKLWAALLAEFLGLCIFQIYGGSANDDFAAFANGFTLAVIIYATCNISGGHLNPAVSFANCLTGHMSWSKGGLYCLAQVLGAIFGAFIESGLMPGVLPGDGHGPGCFTHLKGVQISKSQLFWWELIMTFVLVSVVYATAVTRPGHGSHAPVAIGFTLFASAAVGGQFTGAALNPARVLGPTLVFDCFWETAFVYIAGQLLGGFAAAVLVLPLYGFGQFGSLFDTRILSSVGLNVAHDFHKLPEQEAVAAASENLPAYSVAVSAGDLPPNRPGREASLQLTALSSVDSPRSAAQSFQQPQKAVSQTWSPTVNSGRVFGNPQFGQVSAPASPSRAAVSAQRTGANDLLPDQWRTGYPPKGA